MYREMASYRIDDMVRDAEAYRRTKQTRAGRSAERRGALRRFGGAVLSALLWPVRH